MVDRRQPEHLWRKSTRCNSGACVEVAKVGESFLIRDSKNPDGPTLRFTPEEWDAFVAGMTAGDFIFE